MGNNITKNEKAAFEDRLYIYEAALAVLEAKVKLFTIEYNKMAKTEDLNEIQKITSRVKEPESIALKLKKDNLDFTIENIEKRVHDVVGVRIVCLTLNDVDTLVRIIRKSIDHTDGFTVMREKDYINHPKDSGYKSFHFQIEVPVHFSEEDHKVRTEVQVRTTLMDAWATLEHKLRYKNQGDSSKLLENQFAMSATILEKTDESIATFLESSDHGAKKK